MPLIALAQPQKARQAVLTLTTYSADGSVVATAPGVFVSKDGTALSAWKPFEKAVRAEVKDARGRTFKVGCIYGASTLNNVVRFRVDGITDAQPLTPTSAAAKSGTTVYVMSAQPQKTTVQRTEPFNTSYTYTVLQPLSNSVVADKAEQFDGAAVVNEKGDLLGLYHYTTSLQSAVDARYVNAFAPGALSTGDATLRLTGVRIALPANEKDAQVSLMIAANYGGDYQMGAARDFIAAFPTSIDGYYSLATVQSAQQQYADADKTMQQALSRATDKAEAHYDYSRLMSSYLTSVAPFDTTGNTFAAWTWEKVKSEADAAVKVNPLPIYKAQSAEALLGQKEYAQAYDAFMALADGKQLQGEPYYKAFVAKSNLGATNDELIELLNQAIGASDTAFAATYFYARAVLYDYMGKYREALRDYVVYENLDFKNLTGEFYYRREQCERNGKFWQLALQDIAHAVLLSPRNADYWGEWASLSLQLSKFDDALRAADRCLQFNPEAADALLIKGVALCEQGKKGEGLPFIQQAKEKGNAQADGFLAKYK